MSDSLNHLYKSPAGTDSDGTNWNYDEAFSRNLGLITVREQQRLRNSRVAIAGMGGVGGIDLVTLVRLGVGRFNIADPDTYAPANTNRQFGAMSSTMGQPKVHVMADIARDINPEIDIRVFTDPIGADNADEFLRDADLYVDAIEFYEIDSRRTLFQKSRANGIYAITAGPIGFSGIWLVFDPAGMSYDAYCDMSDDMTQLDKIVAFAIGAAPKATHKHYMDLNALDVAARTAPCSSLACNIAAGGMCCEVMRILLNKGSVKAAPHYYQFDPYVRAFKSGYIWWGNRNPLQRFKRWMLKRLLKRKLQASHSRSE